MDVAQPNSFSEQEIERFRDIWLEGNRAYIGDVCPYTEEDEIIAWEAGLAAYAGDICPYGDYLRDN